MPVLVLHEAGAALGGARPDGAAVRALVTLDGSVLAKAALEPAALLIVRPPETEFHQAANGATFSEAELIEKY